MFRIHDALKPLLVDKGRLKPHPQNPNNGDVEMLAESCAANGVYRPIYAQRDGTIVAGHHLYTVMLAHGHAEVPVLWVDGDGTQGKRILLADNRVAALAKVDEALAIDILDELEDVFGTGYSVEALAEMRAAEEEHWGVGDADSFDDVKQDVTCPNCGETFRPE